MRLTTIAITTALMASGASAIAQQRTKSSTDYLGQSWVGILTAGDCQGGGSASKNAVERASELTTSGRTTTPAVDASGTRGSSTSTGNASEPSTHDSLPRTGDIQSSAKEAIKDPDWPAAKKQAASLASTCRVTTETTRFLLLLPDGRMLPFDGVANTAIVKQFKARTADSNKPALLRVRVTGKLQNGKIALDSIRM